MNTETMRIEREEINMESLENGYKEAFKELCELENAGKTNSGIYMLFNEKGEWAGEVREFGFGYRLNELQKCNLFRLEADVEDYIKGAYCEEWKNDVRAELND